jgi:hypothetical protein
MTSAPRVPRWPTRGALRAGQDRVAGVQPSLLGGPGSGCHRVCVLVPDVPAHQGGALLAAWAPPPPAAVIAARQDDWGGLDRWAADDGGWFRHEDSDHVNLLSSKVHAVPTRSTATAADAAAIIRDMCLPSNDCFPQVPRRASRGPRLQVHKLGVPCLRARAALLARRRTRTLLVTLT